MNWRTVAEELTNRSRGGMTRLELSNCGQFTISDLARGATEQPNTDLGLRFLELHTVMMIGQEKRRTEDT
jgi:hypothetical protein